jgi:minor extracellular serine protease Vpr
MRLNAGVPELAYTDGAQVVNMSIGAALVTFPEYPTSVAADNLVGRGVVVVTSIGTAATRASSPRAPPASGTE